MSNQGLWNLFNQYSNKVWLVIIVSLIIQIIFSLIVAKTEFYLKLRQKFIASEVYFIFFNYFVIFFLVNLANDKFTVESIN